MYTVTIRKPSGYEFNYAVEEKRLREFLATAGSVLLPGETLSYCKGA